jgi:protein SCO1
VKARLVAVIGVAALLLAACSSGKPAAQSSELNPDVGGGKYSGAGLTPPQPRPSFVLTDTAGQSYDFAAETAGKPTLLYFGYTHCPDVCPTTMADIGIAISKLSPAQQAKVQVVFVTTDVKQDTGPVIAAWLAHFDPNVANKFVGLYGTQSQIDAAQAAAHVMLATDEGQQHAADVLLYGSDNYAHVEYLQSDSESDQMAHDLPLVGA